MPSHQPDAQAVDQVLHLFPQPVAVIGAVREGELGGLTAAWVTRVSVNPALIMVAVGHERHTWHLLETAACFSVSLLGEDQIPVPTAAPSVASTWRRSSWDCGRRPRLPAIW